MADLDTELREEPVTPASPSSVEGDTVKRRHRLWLLVVAHVVLGLFFGIWSAVQGEIPFVLEFLLVIPVLGVVLAQTSLLGLWAAFSTAKWPVRLVGLIVGINYLEFLISVGGQTPGLTSLAAMATVVIAVVFRLVRWRYADLRLFSLQSSQSNQEGLKFSIRGLLLFTFIVAITIVGLKELRENAPASPNVLTVAVWSLSVVMVGLAGVWAALGLARPTQRSIVVLLMSVVLGALFVYTIRQADGETYFYIVSIMVLQAGVLIASLLVARSYGYRLVRKSIPDVEPLD